MSDTIHLRGLRALGRHGVLEIERVQAQPFEMDVEITTDFAAAAKSDDLGDTINYDEIARALSAIVESEQFTLLEALVERLAAVVLSYRRAERVTIDLRKLRPPVAADLASAGVRITRSRDG